MAPRANQAAWEKTATDLSADLSPSSALGVRSIEQMADLTGMSVDSIRDTLFRPKVEDPGNPRHHLCRPAYRVDSTPYWSIEQGEAARSAIGAQRARTGRGPALPMISGAAADATVSVREIAAMAVNRDGARGVHDQTVRKWANGSFTSEAAGPFPEAIGRRAASRYRGNPETVRDRGEVLAWLLAAGFLAEELHEEASEAALRGRPRSRTAPPSADELAAMHRAS